jgi:hypothetical protein
VGGELGYAFALGLSGQAFACLFLGRTAMKWFLSSTYEDLREHREKAAQAIERLEQRSVRMEAFGARPGEAGSVSGDEVRSSEGFIGIYAHRYGYIPKDSDISITEMEFKIAKEANIPTLCFLINEDFPWSPKYIEKEPGQSKLKSFKDDI